MAIPLTSNVKFRRLAARLKSPALARGCLELMWEAAYQAGDAYVGSAEDLEQLVGWQGRRGELAAALLEAGAPGAGFIEPWGRAPATTGVPLYQIHHLFRHSPPAVTRRARARVVRNTARTCAACHHAYYASNAQSRYCSGACRQASHRARRRGADADGAAVAYLNREGR